MCVYFLIYSPLFNYNPLKDRNNVAYHKNKRHLSPIGGVNKKIVENSSGDGSKPGNGSVNDDEGWQIATGTRRRIQLSTDQTRKLVTPILIRHRRSINEDVSNGGPILSFSGAENDEFGSSDDDMEVGDSSPDKSDKSGEDLNAGPRRLGENSLFITPRPEGGMRDLLIVECSKINGNEFKGTITYTEAMVKIYQQKLGLPVENLHAIKMSYSTCRVVTFKLENKIKIDEMLDREEFNLSLNSFKIKMKNVFLK